MNTPAETETQEAPETESRETQETPKTETQETPENVVNEVTGDGRTHVVASPDGRAFSFTQEEMQYLATRGLAVEMGAVTPDNSKAPANSKAPDNSNNDAKDEPSPADILKRLDKMESDRANEKRQAELSRRRESMAKNLQTELETHEILSEDKNLMEFTRKTVLNNFTNDPTKPLSKHVEEVVNHLTGGRKAAGNEYRKGKRQDAENTRSVSARGETRTPSSEGEKPKFTAADFASGKIREAITEKFSKSRAEFQ